MRVFVTGGTGLLGNTVIRELCDRGEQVLAHVRSAPDPPVFQGLDIELVHAPLIPAATPPDDQAANDQATEDLIEEAISRCDAVVHAAAKIHLGWKQMEESMRVNVEGTRRIAQACLRQQKRLVYIGTVNAIAVGGPQTIADETTPLEHAGGQVPCAYVVSKRASLQLIHDLVAQGLDAVVLHPGFMLGPWDWKPSSGRMMLEVGTGWKAIAPSGGCSLCDSRDVARAVVAAIGTDCPSGREYILAGHNWTYKKLWTEMAKRMGTRPPLRAAGPGMEYLAGLVGDLRTRLLGTEVDVNSAGVQMSSQYHWYSSHRAETELAYQFRDAEETLDASAEWIRSRFVLPRSGAGS